MRQTADRIIEKAGKVKLLLLDVDGILTDGRILINDIGQEIKSFHVQDGQGIRWLQKAGIEVGILSGRSSPAVTARAGELRISLLFQWINDKMIIFHELLEKSSLSGDQVAYGGDDFIDLKLLKAVGFSFSVPNAHPLIQEEVDYLTGNTGGYGAVREVCELILKAQGRWDSLLERYGLQRDRRDRFPAE